MKPNTSLPVIALTAGEPAGVGPDLCLALSRQDLPCRLSVLGDLHVLKARAAQLGLTLDFITDDIIPPHRAGALHVRRIPTATDVTPGVLDSSNSAHVLALLDAAIEGCMNRWLPLQALAEKCAARGVRVCLLVQGYTDHPFLQAATRALYRDLLGAGVEIYEYHLSELHAKVAVADGQWATVGSSNIDPFSLLLAREANVVVDDADFARDLHRRLQHAMTQSTPLDPADWQRRPWPQRMLSWLAYAGVRWVVGLSGAGRWV